MTHDPDSPPGVDAPGRAVQRMAGGETFGSRYAEGELIGEGGMGEVRLFADRRIGREVAIKTMLPECAAQDEMRSRFLREAAVQARLEHPAIVPVHDMGVDEGQLPFFIMKCVHGTTLHEVLRGLHQGDPEMKARFSRRKLLDAFSRVCLAADFAHERGVIHRDLKPANIMFGEFGEVYILDWGLALTEGEAGREESEEERLTLPDHVVGTPGYLAPEQILPREEGVDARVDVYALGVILYELLSLERFHGASSSEECVRAALVGDKPSPDDMPAERDVPPELHAIWMRAVAFSPADRFGSARGLARSVEAYLDGVRDDEVRQTLARKHAREASRLVASSAQDRQGAVAIRREAMRHLGRSVALDPDNPSVLRILYDILSQRNEEPPDEVLEEVAAAAQRKLKFALSFGGRVTLSMLLSVPFMLWAGVREPQTLAGLATMVLLLAGAILHAGSRPKVTSAMLNTCVVLVCLTIAYASRWFGPLVLTPGILALIIGAFCMNTHRGHRVGYMVLGCLTIALPPYLEVAGLIPASYRFTGDSMEILPQLVELPQHATVATLTAIGMVALVAISIFAGTIFDYVTRAETRLYGLLWNLRQLIPDEGEEESVG